MHHSSFLSNKNLFLAGNNVVTNSSCHYVLSPSLTCHGIIGRNIFYGSTQDDILYIHMNWERMGCSFNVVHSKLTLNTMQSIARSILGTKDMKRFVYPVKGSFGILFCCINEDLCIVTFECHSPSIKMTRVEVSDQYQIDDIRSNGNNGFIVILSSKTNKAYWNSDNKRLTELPYSPDCLIPVNNDRTLCLVDGCLWINYHDGTQEKIEYPYEPVLIVPTSEIGKITIMNKDSSVTVIKLTCIQ